MGGRLKVSQQQLSSTTAQANALAARLETGVSKRALAEAIATRTVVRGLLSGQTPAQIEADLMAEVRRYEEAAALRHAARDEGSK